MSHAADATNDLAMLGQSAQCSGNHIAVLERCLELLASLRVVAQPVEQLGETPLRGIDAAVPSDGLYPLAMRQCRDLFRLRLCTVVAPEILLIRRPQPLADRDPARASGIE